MKNIPTLTCKHFPVLLTKYQPSLIAACMTHRFHKHKLLLDENMSPRQRFPRLNSRFDVKHIRDDLHVSGISDPEVFTLAKKQKRLIVTLNGDDFRPMAEKSTATGLISVSDHLRTDQVDSKLTALL